MCRSLNPQQQKRQKDSRSPKPVGIYVAPGRAKRLGLRLSFCRFCLEGFQRPTVIITLARTGCLNAFRDGVRETDLSSIRTGLLIARIGQKGPILAATLE